MIDFSFIHSVIFTDSSQLIIARGKIIDAYSKKAEVMKEGTFNENNCDVVSFSDGVVIMKLADQKILQVICGDYNKFYSAARFCLDIIQEMNSVDQFNKNKIELIKKSMEVKKENGSSN